MKPRHAHSSINRSLRDELPDRGSRGIIRRWRAALALPVALALRAALALPVVLALRTGLAFHVALVLCVALALRGGPALVPPSPEPADQLDQPADRERAAEREQQAGPRLVLEGLAAQPADEERVAGPDHARD